MIRAIIVDDEENLRIGLNQKLEKHCPEVEVMGLAASVQEAYDLILEEKPDVVFLDIEMPQENGFDLLMKFEKLDFEVIFVTGYDSYAIDAINFCAIGYVLKPIDVDVLKKAVSNIKKPGSSTDKGYQVLLENMQQTDYRNQQIAIPTMEGIDFVKVDDIIRLEGVNKYTIIKLGEGEQIVSSYNIGVFRKMLDNFKFYLTHKSHMINLNHLKKYTREGTVLLSDGSHVPVSTRKKSEFLELVKTL